MLSQSRKRWLRRNLACQVGFDVPMARHTSFRTGGSADAVVHAQSEGDLTLLLPWLTAEGLPWQVVGGGTNLLVTDEGIPGVVVILSGALKQIHSVPENGAMVVTAGAGATLAALMHHTVARGAAGLTFAAGIPGSVGGAIAMNAGTPEGQISDVIRAIDLLRPDGNIETVGADRMQWAYRSLTVEGAAGPASSPFVILKGRFRMRAIAPKEVLRAEIRSRLSKRKRSQPMGQRSAGCFFKNPPGGPAAGWMIEQTGLKGCSVGDAQVSERHANFIINRGAASSSDILGLAAHVRERVYHRFGIRLENEVKIMGSDPGCQAGGNPGCHQNAPCPTPP